MTIYKIGVTGTGAQELCLQSCERSWTGNKCTRTVSRTNFAFETQAKMKLLLALCGFFALANAHSYHMGACPLVEPMPGFQMSRFLGNWYVIQKTSTGSSCISYNYTRGDEPGEYLLTQVSNNPVLAVSPWEYDYRYTGSLTVPEPSTAGRMTVRFPLSATGSASHVVVGTDYTSYGAIFTCRKVGIFHRQSATILSRTRDLEKSRVDELRRILSDFGVNPFELSIVAQTGCQKTSDDPVNIHIDPSTFSSENLGKIVRKAGEKIGDGVEWIANAGSKVYHKIAGGDDKPTKAFSTPQPTITNNAVKIDTNEVEWIP